MAPKRRKKAPAVGEGAVFNQSTGEMSVELCFCRAMCAVSQPATDRSTSSLHADTYVDLAALCAGEVSELQIKSVIQLLHRALARTETGAGTTVWGLPCAASSTGLPLITTLHGPATSPGMEMMSEVTCGTTCVNFLHGGALRRADIATGLNRW